MNYLEKFKMILINNFSVTFTDMEEQPLTDRDFIREAVRHRLSRDRNKILPKIPVALKYEEDDYEEGSREQEESDVLQDVDRIDDLDEDQSDLVDDKRELEADGKLDLNNHVDTDADTYQEMQDQPTQQQSFFPRKKHVLNRSKSDPQLATHIIDDDGDDEKKDFDPLNDDKYLSGMSQVGAANRGRVVPRPTLETPARFEDTIRLQSNDAVRYGRVGNSISGSESKPRRFVKLPDRNIVDENPPANWNRVDVMQFDETRAQIPAPEIKKDMNEDINSDTHSETQYVDKFLDARGAPFRPASRELPAATNMGRTLSDTERLPEHRIRPRATKSDVRDKNVLSFDAETSQRGGYHNDNPNRNSVVLSNFRFADSKANDGYRAAADSQGLRTMYNKNNEYNSKRNQFQDGLQENKLVSDINSFETHQTMQLIDPFGNI